MKNIILLGGSNSVMVNGLQRGLKEGIEALNLAEKERLATDFSKTEFKNKEKINSSQFSRENLETSKNLNTDESLNFNTNSQFDKNSLSTSQINLNFDKNSSLSSQINSHFDKNSHANFNQNLSDINSQISATGGGVCLS